MNKDILEIDLRKADLTSAMQPTMQKNEKCEHLEQEWKQFTQTKNI